MTRRSIAAVLGSLCAACLQPDARAATLSAGEGTAYPQPSIAIAAALPGDTVEIVSGTYYDCASWRTDRLTVEAHGAGPVVMSDLACDGKGAFVIAGNGTVVRGITFARTRVPDGNGAGIRMEGGSLLVEDCTFKDVQAAVLAAGRPDAELTLRRVAVRRAGMPGATLAAVTVGPIGAVRIEDSRFSDGRGEAAAIRSAAPLDLIRTQFIAGASGLPVVEVSGPLRVEGSHFHITAPRPAALRARGPGASVHGSGLNGMGGGVLLQDWTTGGDVVVGDNQVGQNVTEVSTSGRWWHLVREAAGSAAGALRHVAGRALRLLS